jgi:hypothetical protein
LSSPESALSPVLLGETQDNILHFTEAAYSHPFEEHVKYFLAGNTITKTNCEAVECCIIAEAGMTVSQNNSAKQKELMELIWEKYSEIIRTLDPALWS